MLNLIQAKNAFDNNYISVLFLLYDVFRCRMHHNGCLNGILVMMSVYVSHIAFCLQSQRMGPEAQLFQGRIHLVGNREARGEQMQRETAALLCNRDPWRELEEH